MSHSPWQNGKAEVLLRAVIGRIPAELGPGRRLASTDVDRAVFRDIRLSEES